MMEIEIQLEVNGCKSFHCMTDARWRTWDVRLANVSLLTIASYSRAKLEHLQHSCCLDFRVVTNKKRNTPPERRDETRSPTLSELFYNGEIRHGGTAHVHFTGFLVERVGLEAGLHRVMKVGRIGRGVAHKRDRTPLWWIMDTQWDRFRWHHEVTEAHPLRWCGSLVRHRATDVGNIVVRVLRHWKAEHQPQELQLLS